MNKELTRSKQKQLQIRTYQQWQYELRKQRETEYSRRRRRWGILRKMNQTVTDSCFMKFLKRCYIPMALVIGGGILLTLLSTINGLAPQTSFVWRYNYECKVTGSVLTGVGIISMMALIGVMSHIDRKAEKLRKVDLELVISARHQVNEETHYVQTKRGYVRCEQCGNKLVLWEQVTDDRRTNKTRPACEKVIVGPSNPEQSADQSSEQTGEPESEHVHSERDPPSYLDSIAYADQEDTMIPLLERTDTCEK